MIATVQDQTFHLADFMFNWQKVRWCSINHALIVPPYVQTKHECDLKIDSAVLSWDLNNLLARTGQIAIFSSSKMLTEIEIDFAKYFDRRYIEVLLKPSAIVFHKDRPRPDVEFISVFHRRGLPQVDRVYNHKAIGFQGDPYVRFNKNLEHANVSSKKRKIDKNESGIRYPSSVSYFPNRLGMKGAEKKFARHATQKPIALISNIVKALSNPGDTILDPFMGSGTTLAACYQLGRKGIGFDHFEEFYEMAQNRVANTPCNSPLELGVPA